MDAIDRLILTAVSQNGRASLKEIAACAGLSSPSAAERLRRLEERGVIRGYCADIDPKALGLTVEALIRIRPLPGRLPVVREMIKKIPQIAQCDSITGDDCFMARVFVRSVEQLDDIIEQLAAEGTTNTSIVKSPVVTRRAVIPRPEE
jgi:Lrp/AsnC family transcriptional regulator, leucine-responsive regulatory protein